MKLYSGLLGQAANLGPAPRSNPEFYGINMAYHLVSLLGDVVDLDAVDLGVIMTAKLKLFPSWLMLMHLNVFVVR